MVKNYCRNCGKEITLKDTLMQSIMFGLYCNRCGEVLKANNKSKILFSIIFWLVIVVNIFLDFTFLTKIGLAGIWCIVALWIIQPLMCDFE